MSNNKQSSSIDWIIKQLIFKTEFENLPNQYVLMSDKDIYSIIEQAKAMHKDEIIKSWMATDNELQRISAEQYYNETYGGNNE
jgi:hypothetical protein